MYPSWKGAGKKRKLVMKKDEMMYIPLLKTLKNMLECKCTVAEVNRAAVEVCPQ